MRYLFDTDWLIDVFIGVPPSVRTLREYQSEGIGISVISHGEILEGAFDIPDSETLMARYRVFLDQFETVPLTEPIMEIFGRTRSQLLRRGQLIPDLDLLIATTAVHHDLTLLTRNVRHFARISELRLYQAN